MVCKTIFCSKFPDIPDKAGRNIVRGRTQAIAKLYTFHANAITACLVIMIFFLFCIAVNEHKPPIDYFCGYNFGLKAKADKKGLNVFFSSSVIIRLNMNKIVGCALF